MFENFTNNARRVIRLATMAAQRRNHEYVGTEYILSGIVEHGDCCGAIVLRNLDVNFQKVREAIEILVPAGKDPVTMGKLPLTPRAKKVIEYAIEEAQRLGHNYVGTEHLLLGLLHEQEGSSGLKVLTELGMRLDEVREEVIIVVNTRDQSGPIWPHHNTLQTQSLMTQVETKVRKTFKHPGIELLHVLHGVLNTAAVGADILKELGLTQELVYEKIIECKPIGDSMPSELILTPDTKRFLEATVPAVAKMLGDNEINIDHLALAFAEITEGPVFDLFGECSISRERIRTEILQRLNKRIITPNSAGTTQTFMITLGDTLAPLRDAITEAEKEPTEPQGSQLAIAEMVMRQLKLQIASAKALAALHGKVVSIEIPDPNKRT